MRAVLQRVSQAAVEVEGATVGGIASGLLVLLGVEAGDGPEDLAFIKRKILALRVFDDSQGRMNVPLVEAGGAVLLVSQFTLLGDCRKGNRPSYSQAAPPDLAWQLYQELGKQLEREGVAVAYGRFQATMRVTLVNEGPVTLIVDSRQPRRGGRA